MRGRERCILILLVGILALSTTGSQAQNTTATPTPTPSTGNGTATTATPTPTPATSGNGTTGTPAPTTSQSTTPVPTASTRPVCTTGTGPCTGCRGTISYCGETYCCCDGSVPDNSTWTRACPIDPVQCFCGTGGSTAPTTTPVTSITPTPTPTPVATPDKPVCTKGPPKCIGLKSKGCLPFVQGEYTAKERTPQGCNYFGQTYSARQDGGAITLTGADDFGFGRDSVGEITMDGTMTLCNWDYDIECEGARIDDTKELSFFCRPRIVPGYQLQNTIPSGCNNAPRIVLKCVGGDCLKCHDCVEQVTDGTEGNAGGGGGSGSQIGLIIGIVFAVLLTGALIFYFRRKNRTWSQEKDEIHGGNDDVAKKGLGMAPPPDLKKLPAVGTDQVATARKRNENTDYTPHEATRVKFRDNVEQGPSALSQATTTLGEGVGAAAAGLASATSDFFNSLGGMMDDEDPEDWDDAAWESRRRGSRV